MVNIKILVKKYMSRNTVKDEIVLERLDQYFNELNQDSKKTPDIDSVSKIEIVP